jgi:hypothetical protein
MADAEKALKLIDKRSGLNNLAEMIYGLCSLFQDSTKPHKGPESPALKGERRSRLLAETLVSTAMDEEMSSVEP